jgi:hypothetical protein
MTGIQERLKIGKGGQHAQCSTKPEGNVVQWWCAFPGKQILSKHQHSAFQSTYQLENKGSGRTMV